MVQDTVINLAQPGEFCDALTEVLRQGARTLLENADSERISELSRQNLFFWFWHGRNDYLNRGAVPFIDRFPLIVHGS